MASEQNHEQRSRKPFPRPMQKPPPETAEQVLQQDRCDHPLRLGEDQEEGAENDDERRWRNGERDVAAED